MTEQRNEGGHQGAAHHQGEEIGELVGQEEGVGLGPGAEEVSHHDVADKTQQPADQGSGDNDQRGFADHRPHGTGRRRTSLRLACGGKRVGIDLCGHRHSIGGLYGESHGGLFRILGRGRPQAASSGAVITR